MKELLVLMATVTPKMEILETIHTMSANLIADPADVESEQKLGLYCQLLMVKNMVGEDMSKACGVMEELKQMDKAKQLFSPGKAD